VRNLMHATARSLAPLGMTLQIESSLRVTNPDLLRLSFDRTNPPLV
jgi:hypothetical protein